MLEPLGYGKDIPDEVVWDLVSRWHGMRLLFALYLDTAIQEAYVNSTFPHTSGVNRQNTTGASVSEGEMPKPSQIPGLCAEGMTPDNRKGGYERFHKALTAQ
ncbi:uncharacterized protein N7529_000991 [Penicillium soppii]|uniref:uncharacterized protein n=1 Tax=Penicillium soppii TaxID=69789 RepID=UPI0025499B0B|nr:uncharacterized protein N7529_000991 [Penicillium soppii]KAJ5882319.1 hypothetical protein N7529_000991 [Penicillium soppii]